MIIIDSTAAMARALDQPIDPDLRRLLALRRDQLSVPDYDLADLALFVAAAPGDSLAAIEAALGFPITDDINDDATSRSPDGVPSWEWITKHSSWWEACFILSDDGVATVLFVPNLAGVDPALLALCREHAATAVDREEPVAP